MQSSYYKKIYKKEGGEMNKQPPKIPDTFAAWGEWTINEIKVSVIDENFALISYYKAEVNHFVYRKRVKVNWIERQKGITLESKLKDALVKLKYKLEQDNNKIKEMKRIEKDVMKVME